MNGSKKIKRVGDRKWWMILAGAILIILGFVCAYIWSTNHNIFMVLLMFFLVPGGGYLAYRGYTKREKGFQILGSINKIGPEPNTLSIYKNDVKFEYVENPKGYPWQCLNDGKYYYVQEETNAGDIRALILPDIIYRDPKEYANYLNLPAHGRLLKRRATLVQKLAPFAIVAGMGIVAFLFLVTGGE